jgi:hypothetical protein
VTASVSTVFDSLPGLRLGTQFAEQKEEVVRPATSKGDPRRGAGRTVPPLCKVGMGRHGCDPTCIHSLGTVHIEALPTDSMNSSSYKSCIAKSRLFNALRQETRLNFYIPTLVEIKGNRMVKTQNFLPPNIDAQSNHQRNNALAFQTPEIPFPTQRLPAMGLKRTGFWVQLLQVGRRQNAINLSSLCGLPWVEF